MTLLYTEKLSVESIDSFSEDVIQRIVEIEKRAFGEGGLHNEWLLVPFIRYGRVFIARIDDEIVGCAQFIRKWNSSETAYFYGISMLPEYRGGGLGTVFLREILSLIKIDGIQRVILSVSPQNKTAIYIYRNKIGFVEKSFAPNEYGCGEDRLIMELKL